MAGETSHGSMVNFWVKTLNELRSGPWVQRNPWKTLTNHGAHSICPKPFSMEPIAFFKQPPKNQICNPGFNKWTSYVPIPSSVHPDPQIKSAFGLPTGLQSIAYFLRERCPANPRRCLWRAPLWALGPLPYLGPTCLPTAKLLSSADPCPKHRSS